MQSAYIGKIMELAERDNNVLHILADSGTGYDEMFRKNFPGQFYNFGISEENMVAAAAGMATVGKIPFVYTAGAFLVYRAMEFIRNDVCFQNLNVKITGMGSGLAWSSLGPTHHTTEDVAVLRAIPNLVILSPATPVQVEESIEAAYKHIGPVYIRIGMKHEQEFFGNSYKMSLSENEVIRDGNDAAVYVTGSILSEVVQAAEILSGQGINIKIVNVVVIKPFNTMDVIEDANKYKKIITVEEHNIYGGLCSIISETVACNGVSAKIYPIGLHDKFASGYGTHSMVREQNGLDARSICDKIKGILTDE